MFAKVTHSLFGGHALEFRDWRGAGPFQFELTALTKAVASQLGGAFAEARPGERRQEDLPTFELVLRVRDRMAVDQLLETGKRLRVERGHTAGKNIHPSFKFGVRNRAVDPPVPLGGGSIKIGGPGDDLQGAGAAGVALRQLRPVKRDHTLIERVHARETGGPVQAPPGGQNVRVCASLGPDAAVSR